MLCFQGRPVSEVHLRRGMTIGVKTYRKGLGRRAMECQGSLKGLLLWDRWGSSSLYKPSRGYYSCFFVAMRLFLLVCIL